MNLDSLLTQTCEWLGSNGKDNDVVISTRIRLARNLENFVFVKRGTMEQIAEIENYIAQKLQALPMLKDYAYFRLNDLSKNDIQLLFERHLISKELAQSTHPRAVCFKTDESISIMVNEEDHLRIQIMHCGLNIRDLWKEIDLLDDDLSSVLTYAFHKRFGYLTACPTNVGTGMRVSVMLHLPALRMSQQMNKVQQCLSKFDYVIRGFYGEGSTGIGDFFQLSNQVTLGKSEPDILRTLAHIVPQILNYERQVRHSLLANNEQQLQEYLQQAYDTLFNNDALTSEQAMSNLSTVRMGIYMKALPLTVDQINPLFILAQPSHLQRKEGRKLQGKERDEVRALMFKRHLQNN